MTDTESITAADRFPVGSEVGFEIKIPGIPVTLAVIGSVTASTRNLAWVELLHQASGFPTVDPKPWIFGDHDDAFASLDALTLITPAAQRCQCGVGVACTWEGREGQNPVSLCVACGLTR